MFLPTLNFVGKARISIVARHAGWHHNLQYNLPVLPVDDKPELKVENSWSLRDRENQFPGFS